MTDDKRNSQDGKSESPATHEEEKSLQVKKPDGSNGLDDNTEIEEGILQGVPLPSGMPPGMRKELAQSLSLMVSRTGPGVSPLAEKVTSEHIDKMIDVSEREGKRELEDTKNQRWFTLGYFTLVLALLVFLVIYLSGGNRDFLTELLKAAVLTLGGFGAGFGYSSRRRSKK